jgi:hypothetical protein
MEFTKGYSKLDNNWFSKDGHLQCLTVDEKILLIYLSTIIIMKSPLYEKYGLLHASVRTDTIQKVCGFKNFRRWQATKGLDEKGVAIKAHSNGRHNIYLLGMVDPGYEKLQDTKGYDATKNLKERLFFIESKYVQKFGKMPTDIVEFIRDNCLEPKMIRETEVEGYGHCLFDILFNSAIPVIGPGEKIVSMEKHRKLMKEIEAIKPNPYVK